MKLSTLIISLFISIATFANSPSEMFNKVVGKIVSNEQNEALDSAYVSLELNNKTITSIWSKPDGTFSFDKLNLNSDYRIVILKENFARRTKLIFTTKNSDKTHDVLVKLIAIPEFEVVNDVKRIITNPIDFIPDSYDLTKDAKTELIRIRKVIKKYPYMKIEIGFHTGSRGEAKFLKQLSQKRADVCLAFITKGDVDASRITAVGYGDTKLLNGCKKNAKCSNKQHMINRRSEFLVK